MRTEPKHDATQMPLESEMMPRRGQYSVNMVLFTFQIPAAFEEILVLALIIIIMMSVYLYLTIVSLLEHGLDVFFCWRDCCFLMPTLVFISI